jgi:hypothetical protein
MKRQQAALENLLDSHPDICRGGLRHALRIIDDEIGLNGDPLRFRADFLPTATRWDRQNRALHIYEISSGAAVSDGMFDAICDFAERLLDSAGCRTSIWITDGNGLNPVKVWDVRDELIGVRETACALA